jgi:hypothetical protein
LRAERRRYEYPRTALLERLDRVPEDRERRAHVVDRGAESIVPAALGGLDRVGRVDELHVVGHQRQRRGHVLAAEGFVDKPHDRAVAGLHPPKYPGFPPWVDGRPAKTPPSSAIPLDSRRNLD